MSTPGAFIAVKALPVLGTVSGMVTFSTAETAKVFFLVLESGRGVDWTIKAMNFLVVDVVVFAVVGPVVPVTILTLGSCCMGR